jgi:hypothetical protein
MKSVASIFIAIFYLNFGDAFRDFKAAVV